MNGTLTLRRGQLEGLESLAALCSQRDGRQLSDAELGTAILSGVTALLPCDVTLVCPVGSRPSTVWATPGDALDERALADFEALAGDYPLAAHTRGGNGSPLRLSDVLPPRHYHALAVYAAVFAPLGIEHQLVMAVRSGGGGWCVAFNRVDHDFSDDDIELARLLRAVLTGVLNAPRPAPAACPTGVGALTAQEQRVLQHVRAGASNKQIGSALGISGRTVQKHLEHIYRKLDVGSRTAAAVRVASA